VTPTRDSHAKGCGSGARFIILIGRCIGIDLDDQGMLGMDDFQPVER
jgi:hypothetical protein